jgi:hypothetical protein
MKLATRILILFAVSLCLYYYFVIYNSSKWLTKIEQPEFTDNGRTVDSLKKVYNCESLDYENWNDRPALDSCLTFCLINSTNVPKWDDVDEAVNQFRAMALAVKHALAKPQYYKVFHIVFVKSETINGQEIKVHAAGMEISGASL